MLQKSLVKAGMFILCSSFFHSQYLSLCHSPILATMQRWTQSANQATSDLPNGAKPQFQTSFYPGLEPRFSSCSPIQRFDLTCCWTLAEWGRQQKDMRASISWNAHRSMASEPDLCPGSLRFAHISFLDLMLSSLGWMYSELLACKYEPYPITLFKAILPCDKPIWQLHILKPLRMRVATARLRINKRLEFKALLHFQFLS